jgi:hypothetical protein
MLKNKKRRKKFLIERKRKIYYNFEEAAVIEVTSTMLPQFINRVHLKQIRKKKIICF